MHSLGIDIVARLGVLSQPALVDEVLQVGFTFEVDHIRVGVDILRHVYLWLVHVQETVRVALS